MFAFDVKLKTLESLAFSSAPFVVGVELVVVKSNNGLLLGVCGLNPVKLENGDVA